MRVQRMEVPDFSATGITLNQVMQQLPMLAGNMALNFFQDSWTRQGYIDQRYIPWKKRRSSETGKSRAILIGKGSGALRRSLRLTSGPGYFEVGTQLPYAKIHNEGGTMTVTPRQRAFFWYKHSEAKAKRRKTEAEQWKHLALAKTITIPKRQFMGDSQFLRQRIVKNVERAIGSTASGQGRKTPSLRQLFPKIKTTTI